MQRWLEHVRRREVAVFDGFPCGCQLAFLHELQLLLEFVQTISFLNFNS
jgi:hypothetical protein